MTTLFLEKNNIKQVAEPASGAAAAVTGARVKVSSADRVTIVVSMGDSVAGVTDFTIQQHDADAAGNSKALATTNPYFTKVAAATTFTKVPVTTAASNYAPIIFAADPGVIVFEVLGEDLDVNNGYAWVSLNIADSVAAKIFSGEYILHQSRYMPAYANII